VDFAGGWTDVPLFAKQVPGAVLNAAINLYSYVSISRVGKKEARISRYGYKCNEDQESRQITMYSADFDLYESASDVREIEYNGNIDLVKAAVKKLNVEYGLNIITRSDAPPGSGLGTSASMGVALIGALSRNLDRYFLPNEIAELAVKLETEELDIFSGKQDHYASALGGFSFMRFDGEIVSSTPIKLSSDVILTLEKQSVLAYTGISRLSSNIHKHVIESFHKKENISALKSLAQNAEDMKSALAMGNLVRFGNLLMENWKYQKQMHSSITNTQIDELFDIAVENGAYGGKACGAGGGGCLYFYCKDNTEHKVRKALENAGATVLNFNFDFNGMQTWESNAEN
jgi:D-glycero-alpha-D-manno-heptose-7-phosphate kinase